MTEPQSAVPTTSLDEHAELIRQARECQSAIDFWTTRLEELKDQIAKVMGANFAGTIDGIEAVTYAPKNQFNSTDFRKHYPDMYQLYRRPITDTKFDPEWLKKEQPALYAEFQTRALVIKKVPKA